MTKRTFVNASILHERPTGLGVYVKNVIKNLKDFDSNIEVFCPIDIEGMKVQKVNRYVKPSYKKKGGIVRFLWTQIVLPFKVRKDDILYHPFQYISFFAKSKQIITIHDFIPLHYPEVAKHQYIYYKYLMPLLLKKAYKVVCISNNTKKDLQNFYNVDDDKIVTIYNGFDNKLFNVKNIDKEVLSKYDIDYEYMVMVGASYPHKNLEIIIESYKGIEDSVECKLVIVGKDSDYIRRLKTLTNKLGLEDKVIFLGYVPDEDLPSLYGCAKAFLYPTLYEGFGLPILEAMASGTIVMCSDNSSLPEVAGDATVTFDAKDKEDIGKKILYIINNEEVREKLKMKSNENIKRFSWEKCAEEIYEVIKR